MANPQLKVEILTVGNFDKELADFDRRIERFARTTRRAGLALTAVGVAATYAMDRLVRAAAEGTTAAKSFERMDAAVGGLGRSIGTALLPVVVPLAEKIADLSLRLAAWADEHPRLIQLIGAASIALVGAGGLLLAISATASVVAVMTKGVVLLTAAMGALTAVNWAAIAGGISAVGLAAARTAGILLVIPAVVTAAAAAFKTIGAELQGDPAGILSQQAGEKMRAGAGIGEVFMAEFNANIMALFEGASGIGASIVEGGSKLLEGAMGKLDAAFPQVSFPNIAENLRTAGVEAGKALGEGIAAGQIASVARALRTLGVPQDQLGGIMRGLSQSDIEGILSQEQVTLRQRQPAPGVLGFAQTALSLARMAEATMKARRESAFFNALLDHSPALAEAWATGIFTMSEALGFYTAKGNEAANATDKLRKAQDALKESMEETMSAEDTRIQELMDAVANMVPFAGPGRFGPWPVQPSQLSMERTWAESLEPGSVHTITGARPPIDRPINIEVIIDSEVVDRTMGRTKTMQDRSLRLGRLD